MSVRKLAEGRWQVNIQPGGRTGRQIKRIFATQKEAKQFDTWAKAQAHSTPEWAPAKADNRRLSVLVSLWWEHHGRSLRAGKDTKSRLMLLAESLGDPPTDQVRDRFIRYRSKAADAGKSLATINREHAYLRAALNELRRVGEFTGPNPVQDLRQFRLQQTELAFLDHNQITELLDELRKSTNQSAELVALICLSTGARWSEAETLELQQIRAGMITFNRTKSYKNRSIPVFGALVDRIKEHAHNHPTGTGRLFSSCYAAFLSALERTSIQLPAGQASHVLRHTFASHFMMNGGNILVLQRALGHSSLEMTMRYAHFAPDHMAQVVELNPLTRHTQLEHGIFP